MTAVRHWWALIIGSIGLTAAVAGKAAAPPPRVLGLSHVAVKATDFERSVSFYRDFLGFAEQGRLVYPNNGRRELTYFKISDTQTIEVFDAANVTQQTGRIYQVALIVEDAEAMRAHLARHGFKLPPQVPRGQMKNANFTVRDPNGTVIEFVQYLPEGRMIMDRGKYLSPTRISNHLIAAGIATGRLAETLRFFRDTLGASEAARGNTSDASAALARLQVGGDGDCIEVVAESADPQPFFRFAVPDLEAAKARLECKEYFATYGKPLTIGKGTDQRRVIHLWDPEGIRVELVQSGPVPAKAASPLDAPPVR